MDISRRTFLKIFGASAAAAALPGCNSGETRAAAPKVTGPMTMRTTPSTGDKVSILGYGCMRLPMTGTGAYDQDEVNRQVDYALRSGVNYFDTSPVYCQGESETIMGKALSRHPRDSYFIATKMSNFAPDTWPRQESIAMFERSLANLRTDYIDYMLLHSVGGSNEEKGLDSMGLFNARFVDNGILDFLKAERDGGRVRNLGFSFHGDVKIFDYLLQMHDRGEVKWDFVQIQLNYLDWEHAGELNPDNTNADYLYSQLAQRNIPAVIMEPLRGGSLATVDNSILGQMKQRRPNESVASWAFRFAGTPEGVLTVLSGMTYMEHLQENVATYSSLEPVTDEEHAFLMKAADHIANFPSVPCTDCKYCMPCPYGVDIPTIFAHYNKCLMDGYIVEDPESPDYDKAARRFLIGYDRKVEPRRQADHCIGCGGCLSECPQRIKIPTELHKIDAYANTLKRNRS